MQGSNYKSRIIKIGDLALGSGQSIRIQSMTSTKTMNTKATVAQSIRMIEAGCEMVRITAPGVREAKHLAVIKSELKKRGFTVPLIADIHFSPKAAEVAASIVEKVRINPGNYTDRARGKTSFTDSDYQTEIEKIHDRIKPLIKICKTHGTTIRIGSNHGSLSERILFRYGDTPEGMVESALEFVRICERLDFHQIVLSMKASNVKVMVQANRLLLAKMMEEGMNYPLHLGVTEAGDAEDGRIKSAAGIGPLLLDGIGDTIRVSLTEEPEFEIPVAKQIIQSSGNRSNKLAYSFDQKIINPFSYNRRKTEKAGIVGGNQVPVVLLTCRDRNIQTEDFPENICPDFLVNGGNIKDIFPETEIISADINSDKFKQHYLKSIKNNPKAIIIIDSSFHQAVQDIKNLILQFMEMKITNPIILKRKYDNLSDEDFLIKSSSDFAYLLVDGLIDGIWLESEHQHLKKIAEVSFGILQATGARITKTEYIACPSCGRTLFNIQQALQEIKSKTNHLKGLKIAVMGCIVNGPGEMADAHYGYVGTGKGEITLYKQKKIIKKGIPEQEAVDELINMIKTDGKWIDQIEQPE